jgi:hypothetical protein
LEVDQASLSEGAVLDALSLGEDGGAPAEHRAVREVRSQ